MGNLTVGGTGKTPMVEWVARWYRERAKRVTILSRGYRQVQGLNDEGRVLEENLPDVPHLQDPDRVRSARIAVEELEAELLVLDDGFQHRRLARDLDVVLLDALEPFGLGRLLPRGLLREPATSLRRADVVVLSRADLISPRRTGGDPRRGRAPRRCAELGRGPARSRSSSWTSKVCAQPLDELAGKPVAAFCGIGNPEGFRRTLLPLCGSLLDLRVFPDHHEYDAADVESLSGLGAAIGANLVLTTQKDLVKLRCPRLGPAPLRALKIGLEIVAGEDVMEDALARLLKAPPPD